MERTVGEEGASGMESVVLTICIFFEGGYEE